MLRVLGDWRHLAVVSDSGWPRRLARWVAPVLPVSLRTYDTRDRVAAIRWAQQAEPAPIVPHELLPVPGVLILRPEHALTVRDIEALESTLDAWFELRGELRAVVIQAERLPGWHTPLSFLLHARLVRQHRRTVERVAFVMDRAPTAVLRLVAQRLIGAQLAQFPADALAAALQWVGVAPLEDPREQDPPQQEAPPRELPDPG